MQHYKKTDMLTGFRSNLSDPAKHENLKSEDRRTSYVPRNLVKLKLDVSFILLYTAV